MVWLDTTALYNSQVWLCNIITLPIDLELLINLTKYLCTCELSILIEHCDILLDNIDAYRFDQYTILGL